MNYKFFPHYAILGYHYLRKSDNIIIEASLVVDDACALFDYVKSSGVLLPNYSNFSGSNQLEKSIYEVINEFRSTEINGPIIAYWTGKQEIFLADTVIGKISAHGGIVTSQNSKEISMKKKISVDFKSVNPVNIETIYEQIDRILRFLEIISGRSQNLLEVKITIQEDRSKQLSVHLNTYPGRAKYGENSDPDSDNVLINAANKPDEFARLMSAWLDRDETWRTARRRFSDIWGKQRSYDPDRIVAAANMFDLLPQAIFPEEEEELSGDLIDTIQKSRGLFRQLSPSPERDGILTYLGQMKKLSLKQKIRHRSQMIKTVISSLQQIDCITDKAVELRHFYVHGDKPDGSREKLIPFTSFLTDTLEFVFCMSDFIELGWDFLSWHQKPKTLSHPFSSYIYEYPNKSEMFLAYLEEISR